MYTLKPVPFAHTSLFGGLFSDYLNQSDNVKAFFSYPPTLTGFKNILSENSYDTLDRQLLSSILLKQCDKVSNSTSATRNNIDLLKQKNAYTLTTGHQLCLFTGPLYFIHKIISVIQLAEKLTKEFPDKYFVPVYWMAGEDHDAEEINHTYVYGNKISWSTEDTGSVGNFNTGGIAPVLEELKSLLGNTTHTNDVIELFRKAYLEHNNLNDATRFLVNELFGKFGLVIADGNDIEFKKQFKEEFREDILQQKAFKKVSAAIEKLKSSNYSIQVNPREINCFYMDGAIRSRIEKQDSLYKVVQTNLAFTETEMLELIEQHPEKISPNVVLRPLYQQKILPNIAYCGGPGEIAYWLEYLDMFKSFGIDYPVLVPRNFVSIIDKNVLQKMEKLKMEVTDVFAEEQVLIQNYLASKGITISLSEEKSEIEDMYAVLLEKAVNIDKTLEASVKAEMQKAVNGISVIEGKLNKALKSKSDTEINQIKTIKNKLFPLQSPQERIENVSSYLAKYGINWIDSIYHSTNVLSDSYQVLTEN